MKFIIKLWLKINLSIARKNKKYYNRISNNQSTFYNYKVEKLRQMKMLMDLLESDTPSPFKQ